MEANLPIYVSIPLLLLIIATKFLSISRSPRRLPPSPFPKLPILGHLHLLKVPLHRTLENLSKNLGPIFSLQLGSRLVVVVSSPSAVEECFTKNDIVFADRPRPILGKYIGYNYTAMVMSSYGDHWRNLRRLSTVEIFSTGRLNMFLSIRRDEVNQLLRRLSRNLRHEFAKVEMKSNLNEFSFNIIMRMIAGKRYYGEDVDNQAEAKHFREIIEEIVSQAGAANPADYLPILRWIDYKGYEKGVVGLSERMDKVFEGIIDEHRRESRNSMLDLQTAEWPVIYRDFKTSNILLDSDYTAKLSDFGLAKAGPQGDETHVSTRVMGTYGYAATSSNSLAKTSPSGNSKSSSSSLTMVSVTSSHNPNPRKIPPPTTRNGSKTTPPAATSSPPQSTPCSSPSNLHTPPPNHSSSISPPASLLPISPAACFFSDLTLPAVCPTTII